ncbi:Molybdenum cofactor synthesis protein, partial [human gut metagenome]
MAVVTVEKALQLWDEALQTQVHKVETIDVKAAKGYVLVEDIIAPTDVPA